MISEFPIAVPEYFPDDEIEMSASSPQSGLFAPGKMNVAPGRKAKLTIVTQFGHILEYRCFPNVLLQLPKLRKSEYSDSDAVQIATDSATIFIPLADMIDFEAERTRLAKEREQILAEIERSEKKLANEGFVSGSCQCCRI